MWRHGDRETGQAVLMTYSSGDAELTSDTTEDLNL